MEVHALLHYIMTVLSLRKIPFYISGKYRAEVLKSLILLFVNLILLCCPVLFQARPIDSLNRTSYFGWAGDLARLVLTHW